MHSSNISWFENLKHSHKKIYPTYSQYLEVKIALCLHTTCEVHALKITEQLQYIYAKRTLSYCTTLLNYYSI